MVRCLIIKLTKALLFYNEEELIAIMSENVKVKFNVRVELCLTLRQLSHMIRYFKWKGIISEFS